VVGLSATDAEALLAAGTFGNALRASPEFASLVRAGEALTADTEANAAIEAFGRQQTELQTAVMFGTLSDTEGSELEALQAAMLACPTVAAYVATQNQFQAICRETAAVISGQIGIDFAANCRTSGGCCG
jgi:cell fate (sporulation/competence/biofilm development) regulator YlbF (YheA/YmcA/DUF963 family)